MCIEQHSTSNQNEELWTFECEKTNESCEDWCAGGSCFYVTIVKRRKLRVSFAKVSVMCCKDSELAGPDNCDELCG